MSSMSLPTGPCALWRRMRSVHSPHPHYMRAVAPSPLSTGSPVCGASAAMNSAPISSSLSGLNDGGGGGGHASSPPSRRRLRDHDLRQPLTRPSQPASPDGTPPTCAAHPEGCSAGRKCDGGPTSLQLVWTPLVAGDFYDKEPPILLAVRHGHNEILEILLETVRRWRLPDLCLAAPRARISPLGLAAHRNNEEALFLLLMGRCGRPRVDSSSGLLI